MVVGKQEETGIGGHTGRIWTGKVTRSSRKISCSDERVEFAGVAEMIAGAGGVGTADGGGGSGRSSAALPR